MSERLLFVTGKLAEPALRQVLATLAPQMGFEARVAVLGISVAALMHVSWVRQKLHGPLDVDRVILPGWCQGDLGVLQGDWGVPVERGPKDLRDLPEYFGRRGREAPDLSQYDLEILAEINHAPRLAIDELSRQALALRAEGADVIDLGCVPGEPWTEVGPAVRRLRDLGLRLSIDSFERAEVEQAVEHGAELVLSCNSSNRDWLAQLPAELVAIPDQPITLDSLDDTVQLLQEQGARFRLDPILEPIGFGFAASLGRYLAARQRWPGCEMLMGAGNLTELTEADSAGMNLLLCGFCEEQQIRSVLTTQVINWSRSSVRELDLARRLTHFAVQNHVLPKHLHSGLVMLRDARVRAPDNSELRQLASQVRDPNFRIFAAEGELHVLNREGHWQGTDPFELFERLAPAPTDPNHAFYLGYELAKAVTALTLGKNYRQDEALDWGFLTQPEISARHRRSTQPPDEPASPPIPPESPPAPGE